MYLEFEDFNKTHSFFARPTSPACLQYHTGVTGRFSSFNFLETTAASQHHLPKQQYSICIRPEAGYCCIEFQLCDDTDSWKFHSAGGKFLRIQQFLFSINTTVFLATTVMVGTLCTADFVSITGAAQTCDSPDLTNRLCGQTFSAAATSTLAAPSVCCKSI